MLDLSALDLATIPERPEGADRIVAVIVVDAPGTSHLAAVQPASVAFVQQLVDQLGASTEDVHVRSLTVDAELTEQVFAYTGTELLGE